MYRKFFKLTSKQATTYIAEYVIVLLILVLRQWEVVGKPFLVSEDGTIFINRAINGEFLALITSYAGYYHFIPQFLTNAFYKICEITNNVTMLPYMMWGSSVLIATSVVFYFTSERFAWVLEKRRDRLIVCCLIVLLNICEINDLHGTLTNIQWWLGFYFFLVSLSMFHERKMPPTATIILLALCGFSTMLVVPLFAMFAVLITYITIKCVLCKGDIVKFVAILIPFGVQVWSIMHNPRISQDTLLAERAIGIIPSFFNLAGKLVAPQSMVFYGDRMILFGILLIVVLIYIFRKNKQFVIFSLLYSLAFLVFCILPLNGNQNNIVILAGNYTAVSGNVGGRYWFVSLMIMALLLSVALVNIWSSSHMKPITILVTAIIAVTIIGRFDVITYLKLFGDYTVNYKQFAPLYSNTGTYCLRIPLHEPNWHVTFPSDVYTVSPNVTNINYAIDSIDGNPPSDLTVRSNWVNISGWMYDNDNQIDFEYIMIEINGTYYPMLRTNGQDVADYFQLANIVECRFSGVIPKTALRTGENTLNFVGIHANKINYAFLKYTFSCTVE